MQNKLSIIIPCFNDRKYIEQSVQSAINQTYVNKEIIVIDDGSNKETKMLLKRLEPKIDYLITQENKGPAAARNAGIEMTNGKYILTLDSDDYFEPEFCEKAVKIMEGSEGIKVVTCYARWFKENITSRIFKPEGGDLKKYLIKSRAIGNSLFRKKDWEAVGGYDEEMQYGWEDWEFFIRLHSDGGRTYVIPEVLFHYRDRTDSKTKKANKDRYGLLQYIYTKHAHLYQRNSDIFIPYLLEKLQQEEREKIKNLNLPETKIGRLLLRPVRFLRSLI